MIQINQFYEGFSGVGGRCLSRKTRLKVQQKTNTMQTLQKQRTKGGTKTELSLKQSTVLVQNCCKSFISMVTYLRDVFSDEW